MFQKRKHIVSKRETLCFTKRNILFHKEKHFVFTKGNTFDNLLFVFFN